jgi:hypothetical protein
MARFRKEIVRVGPFADPVLGVAGQVTPDQLALIRQSWRPGIPVSMANGRNQPGEQVGSVVSLERHGNSLVAVLDVDSDTAAGITAGTILGSAAVLDPASQNALTGVMITNRPAVASGGYDVAASYDSDAGLIMLSATTEEPFVSIMQTYPAGGPVQHGQIAELAGPEVLAEALAVWADAQADAIAARHASGAGGYMFSDGMRHHRTYRGQARPPVQLSAELSSADVDQAVAELAAARGVLPHVIEAAMEARAIGRAPLLAPSDKIDLLADMVRLTAAPGEDEVMLTPAGRLSAAEVAAAVDAEVLRLSGEAVALAQRRGHAPGHSAGQHHPVVPSMLGGSPPHPPFFGPHTHAHDHPGSHAHEHTHPDHAHVHADASGRPIVDDGLSGGATGSKPAGMSAGYPTTTGLAGQHFHPDHVHEHHHGLDGLADNAHSHHHAEAPPGYSIPGALGYGYGGASADPDDDQDPAAAEADRIAAQHPYEGFTGGKIKGRSYVHQEANDVTDTDERQPRLGNVIHPGIAEVLSRHRDVFEPAGPLTELKQQRTRTLLGPLGKEGQAHVRRPQGKAGEHPSAPGTAGRPPAARL